MWRIRSPVVIRRLGGHSAKTTARERKRDRGADKLSILGAALYARPSAFRSRQRDRTKATSRCAGARPALRFAVTATEDVIIRADYRGAFDLPSLTR